MKIIATIENGYLIEATERELFSIFAATARKVTRENPIKIGDNIPAFDYAELIQRCKNIKSSADFRHLKERMKSLHESSTEIISSIESLTFEDSEIVR